MASILIRRGTLSSIASCICKSNSNNLRQEQLGRHSRLLSSASTALSNQKEEKKNPTSNWITGLKEEDVEQNPEIAAYVKANFGMVDRKEEDGFVIPDHVLEAYGIQVTEDLTTGNTTSSSAPYGTPKIDLGLGTTAEQQALNIRVLTTYLRTDEEGSAASRRMRRGASQLMDTSSQQPKMIPGVLQGGDPTRGISAFDDSQQFLLKTPWSSLQREVDRFHRHFESRVYDLTVLESNDTDDHNGVVHRVVPRGVQRHPVAGSIYCANFVRYHPGRPISLPIAYVNQEESIAMKRGAFVVPVNKYVECLIDDGVRIPDALELDCTDIQLKDVLRLDRLAFPDGVRLSKRVNEETFVIGPVQGGRNTSGEDDDDEGNEDGGGEESANSSSDQQQQQQQQA